MSEIFLEEKKIKSFFLFNGNFIWNLRVWSSLILNNSRISLQKPIAIGINRTDPRIGFRVQVGNDLFRDIFTGTKRCNHSEEIDLFIIERKKCCWKSMNNSLIRFLWENKIIYCPWISELIYFEFKPGKYD